MKTIVGKIIGTYAARRLPRRLRAGYDDSSVSDITHCAGTKTFGIAHVRRQEPGPGGMGPDMAARNAVWGVVEDE